MKHKKCLKIFPGLLILFFFFLPTVLYAGEAQVIIIKPNSDILLFNQIKKGFRDFLAAHSSATPIEEKAFSGEDKIFTGINAANTAIIFAIGKEQIEASLKNTENLPIITSELIRKNRWVRRDKRIALVSLDIGPQLRLQFIAKALPAVRRIGVIYEPLQNSEAVNDYSEVADALGMTIVKFPVTTIKEVNNVSYHGIDAVLLLPDSLVCQTMVVKNIILSSYKYKIPVIGIAQAFAQAGAVLAIEPDYEDNGTQAGEIALRLLKGDKPEDIPGAFCRKLRHFINKAMAERLSLEIPKNIVDEASFVFGE